MLRRLFLVLVFSFFLSGCNVLATLRSTQKSGLQITSTPQVTVFLDGNSLGITPILEEDLKPGTYTVKLSPSDNSIQPFETQITLTPGVLTVIDRKLSPIFDQSHGYTLSFEKLSDKSSKLAITTSPDSVTVTVDGQPQGFTPVSIDTLTEGDHTILLTSPGFDDKTIRARTVEGYSLTINAQLAKKVTAPVLGLDSEATASATPSAELSLTPTPSKKTSPTPTPKSSDTSTSGTIARPYVEIVNWANVRKGEIAPDQGPNGVINKAYDGEQYKYLGVIYQDKYYKIDYKGQTGWVSVSPDISKLVK